MSKNQIQVVRGTWGGIINIYVGGIDILKDDKATYVDYKNALEKIIKYLGYTIETKCD
jgi:hypothetical protein